MLDAETKARINAARDILVGKVPDPKSQVEQITIALIYKFMDDMDAESESMGGKATFFTGVFKKLAWRKIIDKKLSGHDRLTLYAEGLEKMSENDKIPQLFRDIFKGAFLPYRDPETLNLFLKEIDGFTYDHSERLGDAFEYLLSVLGSQGDAGQFRTPRHIIDFIVRIVDPKKNETVLDPACGTAGFLISAYKHILNSNTDENAGDKLTGAQKKKLVDNFVGYDISPDMARLSRANMYLHGFKQPKIYEYDSLTSEDRWGERTDVCLANPPFMTPKGGIRPHNKFSIKAKRSEVLFVDYIAEHLNVNGRAGVIVPEGIINKDENAYKQLRKMLIEEYLWCVVSLPAGVFNPYSGVKTSILLMDKQLAKKSKDILFVKINADGFDLGAQRREIDADDLPDAKKVIDEYLSKSKIKDTPLAFTVLKKKVLESSDIGLSGDRYRESAIQFNGKFPRVKLGDVVGTITPPKKIQKQAFEKSGKYPIIDQSQNDIAGWSSDEEAVITSDLPLVIFGDHTCSVKYVSQPFVQGADGIKILNPQKELLTSYLYYCLKYRPIESDGYKRHFSKLKRHDFPLPPLDIQKEIVVELDGYRKVIEGANQIIDNYKPTVKIDPKWKVVKLGDVCDIGASLAKAINPELPYIGADSIEPNTGSLLCAKTAKEQGVSGPVYHFDGNKILYSKIRPYLNKVCMSNFEGYCSSDMYPLVCNNEEVIDVFVFNYLLSSHFNTAIREFYERASIPKINRKQLFSIELPLPPLKVQKKIVARLEKERDLVDSNKELIQIYEQKIQDKLAEVWGE